ncbi:MAG: TfoX/Sxy family protein, partial [Clostridia bacterium]
MASTEEYVQYVCEQMSGAGTITYKKMFGEYTIYCDQKVLGLICDNQVFIKPTAAAD